VDGAVAEYREAIRLKSDYAAAHGNLGAALGAKGDRDGAIAEFREAIRIDNNLAFAHHNLGVELQRRGEADAAIAEYREAVRLENDYAPTHYGLGQVLSRKGDVDGAIAEYRAAISIKKDYAEAHCNLGLALRDKGQFAQALAHVRRGHELGAKRLGWPWPSSAQWVKECERFVELDGRLTAALQGEGQPKNVGECLAFAQLCQQHRKHYAAAARFYGEAFASQPGLAENLAAGHRYNAACAAALAGCGEGQDAAALDEKERGQLRRQALDWLRTDLEAWRRLPTKEPDKARLGVTQQMSHWLSDPDFAGVRGPEALAKLPEAERPAWQKLWQDVADTLTQAEGKAAPEKKSFTK
jgi:tetratricopeptide (TPR) repeat protein